jgi:hypothetical protein
MLILKSGFVFTQQLQFHYDFRHPIDPKMHSTNFSTLNFEYMNYNDSTGSFLLKVQNEFKGENNSASQAFILATKNIRYWEPKIFLSISYSGGLGIAPPDYGYYIANSYGLGIAYSFSWEGFYFGVSGGYRYNAHSKVSHDGQLSFFFWKGLLNYKLSISGTFVGWTQNHDIGKEYTSHLHGKKTAFFADPQIWLKVLKKWSVGSRVNCYYHVLTEDNSLQFYPTLGVKYEL